MALVDESIVVGLPGINKIKFLFNKVDKMQLDSFLAHHNLYFKKLVATGPVVKVVGSSCEYFNYLMISPVCK